MARIVPFKRRRRKPRHRFLSRRLRFPTISLLGVVALWAAFEFGGTLPLFASAVEIVGRASVIDGDTIEIRGERIRLHGIDAPESGQWCRDGSGRGYRCGQRAATALSDKIGAGNVRCAVVDRDRYDRAVARCFLGETNLNGWMVGEGLAVAYTSFSVRYLPAETMARLNGKGIWAGEFNLPWDWRLGRRTIGEGGR